MIKRAKITRPYLFLILIFTLLLAGCGGKEPNMDQLAKDNKYHYKNNDLGFSLALPAEFIYYQTQRREIPGFVDIEIFVPTSDISYFQQVSGYAKPIVVRIFNSEMWDNIGEGEKNGVIYKKLGEKGGQVYTIKFWDKLPKDWQNKWSQEMSEEIIKDFKIK